MIKEKYGVDSGDMIFITDTLGDIREADHEGVPTIAVTWGIHDHEYFNREPHDNLIAIVDSVSDLKDKLIDIS
jgi:phosphoglycolate phosphatase-like HAD superfamily hydrolase